MGNSQSRLDASGGSNSHNLDHSIGTKYNIQGSIKEESEDEAADIQVLNKDINFGPLNEKINEIWSFYDVDNFNQLDKIETNAFLKDILTYCHNPHPSDQKFKMVFNQF